MTTMQLHLIDPGARVWVVDAATQAYGADPWTATESDAPLERAGRTSRIRANDRDVLICTVRATSRAEAIREAYALLSRKYDDVPEVTT